MNIFEQCTKPIIGMIHVGALPGTPFNTKTMKEITESAVEELEIYKSCGIDGICIENMHDVPYLNRQTGHEITACMTRIATEIKRRCLLPCGIQILAGANLQAMAVALACDLQFVRAEGFVFSHIADEGLMDGCAGELLRYRRMIGAEHIKIFTDIKKKHASHAITADISIKQEAETVSFFNSDGIIISGVSTGSPIDISEARLLRDATGLPVIAGSGITEDNISTYFPLFDAFIVGSWFKYDGNWQHKVNAKRIESFMKKIHHLRAN